MAYLMRRSGPTVRRPKTPEEWAEANQLLVQHGVVHFVTEEVFQQYKAKYQPDGGVSGKQALTQCASKNRTQG